MTPPELRRTLTTRDAVVVGLASMIGAGVFGVFAPAAQAAGGGLLIAVVIAAALAACNALSTAQLAVQYPTSGGVYAFGRARLGAWWGFTAGWCFVIGKIASCAAIALIFAALVAPEAWRPLVASAAVLGIVLIHNLGVTRTVRTAGVLLVVVAVALLTAVAVVWSSPEVGRLDLALGDATVYGTLQAGGLLFFAFAGYARIATLAEEVRDPDRTIPRAVVLALGLVTITYLVVAVSLVAALGTTALSTSDAPVLEAAQDGARWSAPVVIAGASAACLAALLALIAGISRTAFAMARDRELPRALATVNTAHRVPARAGWLIGGLVVALVWTVDLRFVIGFSSLGVLLYYLIANVSAFTQEADRRLIPRWVTVVGALGCSVLAVTLPVVSLACGIGVVVIGLAYRAVRLRVTPR